MGVSIKESMASGRAIVASNSGGIPEAIRHDTDGYVVPLLDGKIDNKSFAEAIELLLRDQERIDRYAIVPEKDVRKFLVLIKLLKNILSCLKLQIDSAVTLVFCKLI